MILDAYLTGTDTGIGKTHAACVLLEEARAEGVRIAGMKPVASGCIETGEGWRSEDTLAHMAADGIDWVAYADRNPYALPLPVAPEIAAREAGVDIALDRIVRAHARLRAAPSVRGVLAEGVGGWLAPLGPGLEQSDVVRALGLPVLMVVGLRLGCVHQARTTLRAIQTDGCGFAGWIANPVEPGMARMQDNLDILVRVLGEAPMRVLSRD